MQIGPVSILSYGIVLTLSLCLSLFIIWRLYKNNLSFIRYRITLDSFFDSVLAFFVSFGIGARMLHIVEHYEQFHGNVLHWFLFLHFPGFSFLGGIIGGVFGLWFFCRNQKQPFLLLLDLFSVGMPLALAFSRIGSLLAGDSFGKETNFFLSVVLEGMPGTRHPTQLYEAIVAFGIFVILYMLYNRGRFQSGEIFLYFLLLIGGLRFFIEILRGDSVYLAGFAVAQIISLLFVLIAGTTLLYLKRQTIRQIANVQILARLKGIGRKKEQI